MEKRFKYQGLAKRLQTIFDYHRDAILREINIECNSLSYTEKNAINELFSYVMEECVIWPDNVVNLLNNAHKPIPTHEIINHTYPLLKDFPNEINEEEQTEEQKEWQELFID